MEPQDNKQLGLLKAISSHEQAAAALSDLMDGPSEEAYRTMLARIEQNLVDLNRLTAGSRPGDHV